MYIPNSFLLSPSFPFIPPENSILYSNYITAHNFGNTIVLSSRPSKKSSHPPINFPFTKTNGIVFQLYLADYTFLRDAPAGV
jgi:hypothetical protein